MLSCRFCSFLLVASMPFAETWPSKPPGWLMAKVLASASRAILFACFILYFEVQKCKGAMLNAENRNWPPSLHKCDVLTFSSRRRGFFWDAMRCVTVLKNAGQFPAMFRIADLSSHAFFFLAISQVLLGPG